MEALRLKESSVEVHRRNVVLTTFLFFVYAPLALPSIIRGMIRTEKWAFVLWACFMGIIAMLYPPVGDFYRYAEDYYFYKGLDFSHFLWAMTFKFDFFLSFVSYGFGKIGLPVDLVRFLYNFIGYFLISQIYIDLVKYKTSYPDSKTRILMLGFFMSIMIANFVFRYTLSMSLFLYGSYKIIEKKEKKGWIFVLWSVISHFSYLLYAFSLLILNIPFLKLRKRTIVFIVIFFIVLGDFAVKYIFTILPVDIADRYIYYVDGYWASDYLEDHSWRFRLQTILSNTIVYVCIAVYIHIYPKRPSNLTTWVNALLIIAIIAMPFKTMHGRFLIVLMWGIKIFFLTEYKNTKKFNTSLKVLFWAVMFSNIINVWSSRRQLSISDEQLLFTRPTFSLFLHTYDKNWIKQNVDEDGGLTKVKY